jgi:hypothetical protein
MSGSACIVVQVALAMEIEKSGVGNGSAKIEIAG